ncbi:hypothetical protein TSUD_31270 [Trifolium subterraneum]|uniref:Reverse transcriptase domain-containing protein n=1 Tax=Trifolium subterraneum TaxID=3900 RepID=A0A2Z6N3N2_TRISU|nr:hypothetical protein TSUD_31270 [Trifolium subterraneum]
MATNHGNSPSIQVAMEEIRSLQKKVTTMEKERAEQNVDSDDENLIECQPLRQSLWDSKVPDNFKSPHLPTFDGKTDPVEHLMAVGTQTAIIGAPEHLRCKLLSGTLKDAALRRYMNLPNNSIESYVDFHKKFIHQLSGTKHVKVTTTSLFTIRQNYAETLREYLARFSEATITVSNPNQEMFVAAFHNRLKAGHFNESLAQKPATLMQEGYRAKPYHPLNSAGGMGYPHYRRYPADREYTPLNKARVHVLHEILQAGLSPLPHPRMHNTIMGPDTEAWCAYHRCKGHDTERCFRLRDLIEDLIRSGHLRKFLEESAKGQITLPKQTPNQQEGEGDGRNKGEKQRVAVNTISGGFAGGGESISARKRYVSSADILYWDAYKAMHLSDEQLNPYSDTRGHVHFILIARKCYESSLKIRHRPSKPVSPPVSGERTNGINMVNITDLDPREEFQDRRVSPIEDLEQVQIGEHSHHTTNIGTSLQPEEREKIVTLLRNNRDLFAWQPSDIPGIDESITTHKLSISPINKPVVQRKRKVGDERRATITEEVAKLKEAGFIEEIKYPTWLANVVMVKKANGKWRMCVDFTDLNKACPKDLYPLPNIDRLIDGESGYKTLSFMDAYSGYNQIKMHPMDAQHTTFMSNTCNYFYNVMPFGLKNAGATYQRLMDRVFVEQIGKNLEVYIDDMAAKTQKEGEHNKDLEDILKSVRKYNMRLNPAKYSFGVQAGEKACHFFATLRNSERFTWSPECEEAFQKLKVFLASPPILTRPEQGKTLYLYLTVSEKALSSALVQEVGGEEKPFYFVSRTLRGAETRYQKIERLCLAVVITARKLRQYLQSHQVVVKTDYPIKNVLRKPDLAERMVAWSVELSEFDITYIPRGPIKSQALADFVLEMTDPPSEGEAHPWTLSVDESSNLRGSGAGIVLEGPDGVPIEQSLRFAFKASNNHAEYEALIAGMKLAKEMEVQELKVQSC